MRNDNFSKVALIFILLFISAVYLAGFKYSKATPFSLNLPREGLNQLKTSKNFEFTLISLVSKVRFISNKKPVN